MSASIDVYTIYYNPTDYPGLYVIRKFIVTAKGGTPTDEIFTANSLEEVRQKCQGMSVCIPREEGDNPSVVETWL